MSAVLIANLGHLGRTVEEILEVLSNEGFKGSPTLIHGSVLLDRFDERSDIDLIVLSEKIPFGQLCVPLGQTRLDVAVFSRDALLHALHGEIFRGRDGIARALIHGRGLHGEWQEFRGRALELISSAPSVDFKRARNRCRGVYMDMARRNVESRIERIHLAKELADALADLLLRSHGFWSTDGVEAARRLKTGLPNVFAQLDWALSSYVTAAKLDALDQLMAVQFGQSLEAFERCQFP